MSERGRNDYFSREKVDETFWEFGIYGFRKLNIYPTTPPESDTKSIHLLNEMERVGARSLEVGSCNKIKVQSDLKERFFLRHWVGRRRRRGSLFSGFPIFRLHVKRIRNQIAFRVQTMANADV